MTAQVQAGRFLMSVLAALMVGVFMQAAPCLAASEKAIDINTAGIEELITLPGIGPAIARRIVDYREANGSFARPAELMNVKGIGEKTFLKLKDRITTSQPRKS